MSEESVQTLLVERVVNQQAELARAFAEHERGQQARFEAAAERERQQFREVTDQMQELSLSINTLETKFNGLPDDVDDLKKFQAQAWGAGKIVTVQIALVAALGGVFAAYTAFSQ